MKPIEIDGNDGTGKSTLVRLLGELGIEAADRGRMTRATDDEGIGPEPGVIYICLDNTEEICQQRLIAAGKDPTERYHTLADLTHYRRRFHEVAASFGAALIPSEHVRVTLQLALAHILGRPLALGVPKGRLEAGVLDSLAAAGLTLSFGARRYDAAAHGLDAVRLKPRAIPQLVALGFLDAGFCGRDLLADSLFENLVEVADTGRNAIRIMAAAVDPGILEQPPTGRPLIVATEFPHLVDGWLTSLGLAHITLHSHGSTEAYAPRFADIVVDVVETGETLRANGLTPIHTFLHSATVLLSREDLAHRADVRALAGAIGEVAP